ncbi:MAG: hypothetical protein ACR2G7_07560, partial [Acidimicrobiales bacterium]
DHIDDWHLTWRTQLDRLAWLCRAHHQDKTHRGWRLEGPPGDRQWTTAASPASARGPDPPAHCGPGRGRPHPLRRPGGMSCAAPAEGAHTPFGGPAA